METRKRNNKISKKRKTLQLKRITLKNEKLDLVQVVERQVRIQDLRTVRQAVQAHLLLLVMTKS